MIYKLNQENSQRHNIIGQPKNAIAEFATIMGLLYMANLYSLYTCCHFGWRTTKIIHHSLIWSGIRGGSGDPPSHPGWIRPWAWPNTEFIELIDNWNWLCDCKSHLIIVARGVSRGISGLDLLWVPQNIPKCPCGKAKTGLFNLKDLSPTPPPLRPHFPPQDRLVLAAPVLW